MSCDEKELAVRELWHRLSLTSGINRAPLRNPVTAPNDEDYPTINFFDMAAEMADMRRDGKKRHPVYIWQSQIVIEPFVKAVSEDAATDELNSFVKSVKSEIYKGGMSLGGKCAEFYETSYSQYLRPPTSSLIIGISLYFNLRYIEDVGRLF